MSDRLPAFAKGSGLASEYRGQQNKSRFKVNAIWPLPDGGAAGAQYLTCVRELLSGKQTSVRVELWFLSRHFFVSAYGGHVVAESANAGLGDKKFTASELERDPAFLFSSFGFKDGAIAFNRRDAAAFARIRTWALRRFVFVNARKFDLKALLTQRPDFEFTAFPLPGPVDLSSRDTLVAAGLHRNN